MGALESEAPRESRNQQTAPHCSCRQTVWASKLVGQQACGSASSQQDRPSGDRHRCLLVRHILEGRCTGDSTPVQGFRHLLEWWLQPGSPRSPQHMAAIRELEEQHATHRGDLRVCVCVRADEWEAHSVCEAARRVLGCTPGVGRLRSCEGWASCPLLCRALACRMRLPWCRPVCGVHGPGPPLPLNARASWKRVRQSRVPRDLPCVHCSLHEAWAGPPCPTCCASAPP